MCIRDSLRDDWATYERVHGIKFSRILSYRKEAVKRIIMLEIHNDALW